MNQIGDAQFRVMCDMWGVDEAIKAVRRMGMTATTEQITMARNAEATEQERWNAIFKQEPKEGT